MVDVLSDRVRDDSKGCDYMAVDYDLIVEPLNLRDAGRAWFEAEYAHGRGGAPGGQALLMGAVDWMIDMLAASQSRVYVVDGSRRMLEKARVSAGTRSGTVEFVSANWIDLPELPAPLDAVLGDNSFTFLEFPGQWEFMCRKLAARMGAGGVCFLRFFSVPTSHRKLPAAAIVEKYAGRETVNYTEVRTEILFSQWEPATYRIHTETALAFYEKHRGAFSALLEGKPAGFENDLESIAKYRNSGAVYHVPPLGEILRVLEKTFDIMQVSFGPYGLSQYFPLVTVKKKAGAGA